MAQDPKQREAIVQRMIDAGEPEENIALVIQHFKSTEPSAPAAPKRSAPMFGHNLDAPPADYDRKGYADATVRGAREGLPIAAGIATSGMSLPIQAGAAALSGAASRPGEGAVGAMRGARDSAASLIGGFGVGKMLSKIGPSITNMGRKLWLRAAKIPQPILKDTGAMKAGGDWAAGEREIADTVLSRGLGGASVDNTHAIQSAVDSADDAITTATANSTQPINVRRSVYSAFRAARKQKTGIATKAVTDAANKTAREYAAEVSHPVKKTVVSAKYPDAVRPSTTLAPSPKDYRGMRPVEFSPLKYERVPNGRAYKDISVAKAQADKVATYRAPGINYSADAPTTAGNAVRKAVARDYKEQVAALEPAAAAANAEMSKLIPAGKAMSHMNLLQSRREPVKLGGLIFGANPNIVSGLSALMNSHVAKTYGGQALYSSGAKLAANAPGIANSSAHALRAAILANLMASHK